MQPSPRLFARICEDFEQSDVHRVTMELDALTDLPGPTTVERVQAAVVMLSAGDMARFEQQIALAERDWRDVLVAAGLAREDWPKRLDAYLGDRRERPDR